MDFLHFLAGLLGDASSLGVPSNPADNNALNKVVNTTALLRVLPAGLLLLAWTRQLPPRGEWRRILLLGLLNIGFFQAMPSSGSTR